jgi:hypothetical protein
MTTKTKFRAISLWQPWAHLVAVGAKRWDTRSWPTNLTGPLAIHAGMGWNALQKRIVETDPFRRHMPDKLDFGAIVAVVDLIQCVPVEQVLPSFPLESDEKAFGDYRCGRFAWELANVRRLARPFICVGRQGFFAVEIPDNFFIGAGQ